MSVIESVLAARVSIPSFKITHEQPLGAFERSAARGDQVLIKKAGLADACHRRFFQRGGARTRRKVRVPCRWRSITAADRKRPLTAGTGGVV